MFDHDWLDNFFDTIRHLLSEKIGITDSANHNFEKFRINSYNSLSIEKILTFHNVIILIKQVVNKNENKYYSNIFLEKGSLKDKWVFAYYKCYIDISEGADVNKTSISKESHVCYYWYFISYGFNFKQMSAVGVMIYQWCLSTLTILWF